MYWSRPGHRLTTSASRAAASPVDRSVSKVIWSLPPGGGGAASRVPAGSRTSAASVGEHEHHRRARRLGRHQPDAEQLEERELVLLRRLVEPPGDRLRGARAAICEQAASRRARPGRHSGT